MFAGSNNHSIVLNLFNCKFSIHFQSSTQGILVLKFKIIKIYKKKIPEEKIILSLFSLLFMKIIL